MSLVQGSINTDIWGLVLFLDIGKSIRGQFRCYLNFGEYFKKKKKKDKETWHAEIHGVAKSRTRLSDWTELKKKKEKKSAVSESRLLRTHLDSFAWRTPHTQKNLPSGLLSKLKPRTEAPMLLFGHSVKSNSLGTHGLSPPRLLCPWDSPGKNAGVGCHFLLQGIFPTQGWSLRLLHCQVDSLPMSHLGIPKGLCCSQC